MFASIAPPSRRQVAADATLVAAGADRPAVGEQRDAARPAAVGARRDDAVPGEEAIAGLVPGGEPERRGGRVERRRRRWKAAVDEVAHGLPRLAEAGRRRGVVAAAKREGDRGGSGGPARRRPAPARSRAKRTVPATSSQRPVAQPARRRPRGRASRASRRRRRSGRRWRRCGRRTRRASRPCSSASSALRPSPSLRAVSGKRARGRGAAWRAGDRADGERARPERGAARR